MALEIGQQLRRREVQNDDWDLIEIRGWAESSEIREPVVSPVSFGEAVAVDPGNLLKLYTLATDDPGADISASLAELKAEPWQTPEHEVTSA